MSLKMIVPSPGGNPGGSGDSFSNSARPRTLGKELPSIWESRPAEPASVTEPSSSTVDESAIHDGEFQNDVELFSQGGNNIMYRNCRSNKTY